MVKAEEITKITLPIGKWLGVGAVVSAGSSRDTEGTALFLRGLGVSRRTETELLAFSSTGITIASLVLPQLMK